jgi:two-component system LytT family response regulator
MTEALRAIIVDDEALARRGVRQQLERHRSIKVLAECATGVQAVRAISTHDPDIIFLDIQMPGGSGFDVLEQLGKGARPAIIFVTAYSEHAVKAFEVNAVDYVLKPIDDARFDVALERARERLRSGRTENIAERIEAVARALTQVSVFPKTPAKSARRVPIADGERTMLLSVDQIDWLEAAGNYVRIHMARRPILTRGTLSGLAALIDDPRFLRVHRSVIVNSDAVVQIEHLGKGLYALGVRDGSKVETSYYYRQAVAELLEAR